MKKSIRYLLSILVIFSLNFFIPRIVPGDPVANLMGENYAVSAETTAQLRHELGLDKSLLLQYLDYWKGILQLDLGYSYHLHMPVSKAINRRIPWTMALVGLAILIGSVAGCLLGMLAGWARDSWKNRSITIGFLFFSSLPPFYLSLLLLYFFSFKLGWFPLHGFYETGTAVDLVRHYFLPVMVLAIFLTARNYLIMRGSVIQEKTKPYVLCARAKGLYGKQLLFRHVFKNASLPLITMIALDFGFILSGALFIEIVFSLNGMGTMIFEALEFRDYPVLQGIFLVITIMVVAANLIADLIYYLIDPRIRSRA